MDPHNLYSEIGKSISLNWHETVNVQINPKIQRLRDLKE